MLVRVKARRKKPMIMRQPCVESVYATHVSPPSHSSRRISTAIRTVAVGSEGSRPNMELNVSLMATSCAQR